MINFKLTLGFLLSFATLVSCHYTFPTLIVNGQESPQWAYVRQTNNRYDLNPVKDITSIDLRCYTSTTTSAPGTAVVEAGKTIGFRASQALYHAGVVNVYMAKAPGSVSGWDGAGTVWFKVHEISAVTNGGASISWPGTGIETITFTLPNGLPNGEYLLRIEQIALHSATAGGVEFYLGCAQVKVINGGSGNPGPLVAIPGVYTGNEPGIKIDIYYPIPASYTQPGPAVWRG